MIIKIAVSHLEMAPNPATMALVPSGTDENSSIGRHIVDNDAKKSV